MQTQKYAYYPQRNWLLKRLSKTEFQVVNGRWNITVDAQGYAQGIDEAAKVGPVPLGEPTWEGASIPGGLDSFHTTNELLNWVDEQIALNAEQEATLDALLAEDNLEQADNQQSLPITPRDWHRVGKILAAPVNQARRLALLNQHFPSAMVDEIQKNLTFLKLLPEPKA